MAAGNHEVQPPVAIQTGFEGGRTPATYWSGPVTSALGSTSS